MREQYNPFIRESNLEDADLKPIHYDIKLEPDLENASFDGSVVIHFDVLKKTTFILLNAVQLDILSTELVETSGNVTKIPKVHFHAAQETMLVPLPEPLLAGSKIQLRQTFKGRLNHSNTMSGFMRSSYKGADGKSKWIGSTQGQPRGIRQIFPCADEPGLKATFSSTLIVDQDFTCLSNMDIVSEETSSAGKKTVVFNKTPLMSTYLVAFVVGALNYIESNDFRIPIRVYATSDHDIQTGTFALDIGARAMNFHEKTFGSPYPLPKLDMVAVPGHGGGMENWGCVIYDPNRLLRDDSDVAAVDTVSIVSVVIHELAHQWFGNIVTAAAWDSIWLNESFASWATENAILTMFPDWDPWSDFVAGHPAGKSAYQAALVLDSNRASHPIQVPVRKPGEASQIFDAITYSKGESILRMISEFLGVETFIEGVRLHLQRHAFGNATTEDLWDSLSTVSGKDVASIMSIWTNKVGYPILSITEDSASNTIEITQHRFLQSVTAPAPKDDKTLYPVYLKPLSSAGKINHSSQLSTRHAKFSLPSLDFYKLNANQAGFYRVSYPLSRLQIFGSQLHLLSASDRVGLISDFQAVVKAGQNPHVRTSHLLSFLQNFKNETNYFVWRQVLACLQDVRRAWMFEDASTQQALATFQTQLMTPLLNKLDHRLWNFKPTDTYETQNFKAVLFANATGYTPVKAVSSYLFTKFTAGDPHALNPNIRKAVFDIILSNPTASTTQYTKLLTTFRTSPSLPTRTDALKSLGRATAPSLIRKTISLLASAEIQGPNDRTAVFAALASHRGGVEAVWSWLREHLEEVVGGPVGIMVGFLVGIVVGSLGTEGQVREVERFFEGRDTRKFDKFLEQSLDDVKAKARWVERDREEVSGWLAERGYFEG